MKRRCFWLFLFSVSVFVLGFCACQTGPSEPASATLTPDGVATISPAPQNTAGPNGPDQDVVQKEEQLPVVLLPGIMGSELQKENLLWPPLSISQLLQIKNQEDVLRLSKSVTSRLEALKLTEEGTSQAGIAALSYSSVSGDASCVGALDQYGDLARALAERLGPERVSFFGYDWRLSCRENGALLQQWIEQVCQATGSQQVRLVGHSMGGLVISSYLADYGKQGRVAQVVTLGTPFLGSQKATSILREGGSLQDFWQEWESLANLPVFQLVMPAVEDMLLPAVQDVARSLPSLYELLPGETFRDLGLVNEAGELQTERKAARMGWSYYQQITGRLQEIWQGIPHVNIVGTGTATLAEQDERGDGDGTVTLQSATGGGLFQTVTHQVTAGHIELLNQEESRQILWQTLGLLP